MAMSAILAEPSESLGNSSLKKEFKDALIYQKWDERSNFFRYFGVANADLILCGYSKRTLPLFHIFISKEILDSPYERFSSGSAKMDCLTASRRVWFGSNVRVHK
jgi:hypothetical protein